MLVICTLCGKKEEIKKTHKDYQKFASKPDGVYICFNCSNQVKMNAKKQVEPPRKRW